MQKELEGGRWRPGEDGQASMETAERRRVGRLSGSRSPSARICVRFAAATRVESPQPRHVGIAVRMAEHLRRLLLLPSCRSSGRIAGARLAPLSRTQRRRPQSRNGDVVGAQRGRSCRLLTPMRCSSLMQRHAWLLSLADFSRYSHSLSSTHPHRRASGALRLDRVRALFAPRAGSP